MAKKKVPRKQLLKEPDEFISFSAHLIRFGRKYFIQISWSFAAFFALILVISGIRYFSNKAENRAFTQIEQAMSKYETILNKKGSTEAFKNVENDFQQILEKYSGRKGGKIAGVLFANICYSAGEIERATALYHTALKNFDDDPFLKNLILSSLGYAYEEKKDYPSAVKFFERVASEPNAIQKDEALFHLGQLYLSMGKAEQSKEAFKKILTSHTDSPYIEIVREGFSG